MLPVIDDSTRIRVVRALLGMSSVTFRRRFGVSSATLTAWEKGRTVPRGKARRQLELLRHEFRITILPSGMPVPFDDCLQFKEPENASGNGHRNTL